MPCHVIYSDAFRDMRFHVVNSFFDDRHPFHAYKPPIVV